MARRILVRDSLSAQASGESHWVLWWSTKDLWTCKGFSGSSNVNAFRFRIWNVLTMTNWSVSSVDDMKIVPDYEINSWAIWLYYHLPTFKTLIENIIFSWNWLPNANFFIASLVLKLRKSLNISSSVCFFSFSKLSSVFWVNPFWFSIIALRRCSRALVVWRAFSLAARSVSTYSMRIFFMFCLKSCRAWFLLAWIF